MKDLKEELLIGAHFSIAGGVHYALLKAFSIGATTAQLFTSNQRQWKGKSLSAEEVFLWEKARQETNLQCLMSHDSYLINLGSPDCELLAKSRAAFEEEIGRCHQLNIDYLNFHPGAATGACEEECLETIVATLLSLKDLIHRGKTRLLIENTAGQGTSVGYRLDHLQFLIERLHSHIPIGICLDTCHLFAAGYDIRTAHGWEILLEEFDSKIGLSHLYALHVNDSLKPLSSRTDRHASLGKGLIGIDCFRTLMTHPSLHLLPKYLETPEGMPIWEQEIQLLKEFACDAAHQNLSN
jgi:deoxyribonuclease IV